MRKLPKRIHVVIDHSDNGSESWLEAISAKVGFSENHDGDEIGIYELVDVMVLKVEKRLERKQGRRASHA